MISVDNDIVGVFFNGTAIADFIAHDDCPIRDEFRLDVPPELVQPGENVVTFHVLDRGVESFFDARILADLTPDQLVAQLNQTVIVQQTPLVPVDDVLVRCQPDLGGASVSYVVAGTGERAEIKTEGTGADTLSTEISLDDELLASGTITSDEIALSRSLDATERLASLDAGTLSVGSVLTDQLVVAGLFHCIASPTGLSCATTCDLKAAHESGIATLGAGLAKGGGVGADIARRGTLSSVGAAFGGDVISAVAEALAKIRIENARQQCLEGCRQTPPVTPPPVAASATLRCKNGQTILITTNTRGGRCERVGDGVGCADGANFAAGRCSGSPLGLAACVEVEGNACCTVCTRGDQCSRCPEEPRPGPVSAR